MKIAFVSQGLDEVAPPHQNSVGLCTYSLSRSFPVGWDRLVFSCGGEERTQTDRDGVRFVTLPASTVDRMARKLQSGYQRLAGRFTGGRSPKPFSTSWRCYPHFMVRVAWELRRARPSVIHVQHGFQYTRLLKALNPKSTIVVQLHAAWTPQNSLRSTRRQLRSADVVAGVSEFIREGLCRAFPEIADRTMTIYDGVEPQEFPHEPVVPEVPRIVYVGQVSPHKGVHDLIAAFIQLTAELPEATLTIIGPQGAYPLDEVAPVADRETRRRLEPYYSDAGHVRNFAPHYLDALRKQIPPELVDRITFTGQVSRAEVLSRLRHARVAAFPSLWNEGFGMPPVEAMASGTPVVATRSGGVVETVLDGTTGLLVEKGDVPGLVRALSRILSDDDLCTAMSTAARAHALGHFAWPVIAEHAACTYGRARSTTDGSRGKPSVEPLAAAAVTVAPVGG